MNPHSWPDPPGQTAFPVARAGYPPIFAAAFITLILALLGMTYLSRLEIDNDGRLMIRCAKEDFEHFLREAHARNMHVITERVQFNGIQIREDRNAGQASGFTCLIVPVLLSGT